MLKFAFFFALGLVPIWTLSFVFDIRWFYDLIASSFDIFIHSYHSFQRDSPLWGVCCHFHFDGGSWGMYPRVHSDGRTLLSCLESQPRLDFHIYMPSQKISWKYDQDLGCNSPVASPAEAGVEGLHRGWKHFYVSMGAKISRKLFQFCSINKEFWVICMQMPLSEIIYFYT